MPFQQRGSHIIFSPILGEDVEAARDNGCSPMLYATVLLGWLPALGAEIMTSGSYKNVRAKRPSSLAKSVADAINDCGLATMMDGNRLLVSSEIYMHSKTIAKGNTSQKS